MVNRMLGDFFKRCAKKGCLPNNQPYQWKTVLENILSVTELAQHKDVKAVAADLGFQVVQR